MTDLQDVRTAILALVYDAINFDDPATMTRISKAIRHVFTHPLFVEAPTEKMEALTDAASALKTEMRTTGSLGDLASRIPWKHREAALKLVAMALAADGHVSASEDAYWRRLGEAFGFSRLKALEIFHNGLLTHMQRYGSATQDPAPPVTDDARRAILAIVHEVTLSDGELEVDEIRRSLEHAIFHPLFIHLTPRDVLAMNDHAIEELEALPVGGAIGPLAARVPKELRGQAFELAFRAAYADGAFHGGPEAGLLTDLAEALGLSVEEANAIYARAKAEHEKARGVDKGVDKKA
jgi:uncharacterized tellurite resistance protein B-like protein